jgi:sugar (pentulose or hexulose) kinase
VTSGSVAAVDLGASSGRVILGHVGPATLRLEEVHRFRNDPVELPEGLRWDALGQYQEILTGLRTAARRGMTPASVAVDTWGVDGGLLDADGALVGAPVHYRDPRHAVGVDAVHARIPHDVLYPRNGLQFLPFNTLYQLAAARTSASFASARTFLLMPDLFDYWLTGVMAAERTNASTTGLVDPRTREWAWDLIDDLELPRGLFAPLRDPGDDLGGIRSEVAASTGLSDRTSVSLVGSHDTASAVVAVPSSDDRFAYISSGTWSLVGLELDQPILSEASRAANFTNEGGVDGRTRFLRNVMGLWLLQESLRAWDRSGTPEDLEPLLAAAAELPGGGPVIDPDDGTFIAPGDMPTRIEEACRRADQPVPASRPALVRCILDSLALAYAQAIADARRLSGQTVTAVHVVGGGSLNEPLCQLTADACGLPVIAGPVEATAIGNVLVQARSRGFLTGGLETMRALVRTTHDLRTYTPARRSTGVAPGA